MGKRPRRGNGEGCIYRRKDGRWCAVATVGRREDGSPKRVSFYGKTRQEAAEKLTKALNDVRLGTLPEPGRMTVGEWLDIWLQDYKKSSLRPTTFDSYATIARCHLKPALGGIPLKDLRPEHLQRLYNDKARSGLSATTVRYIHAVIGQSLRQAVRNRLVARDVSEATTLPRQDNKEIKPLTREQAQRLLAFAKEDRLYPAIYLELSTGLRRGELLALRWDDLDLRAGTVTVRRGLVRVREDDGRGGRSTRLLFQEPKTPAGRRVIPLSDQALAELRRHKARQNQEKLLLGAAYRDNGLVFCTEDGAPYDPRNFARRFETLLKRAGLPHIRFHDARHSFATMLLELGEHPKVVQQILGHSRIGVTLDTYSHVSLDLEKRAVARLGDFLKAPAAEGSGAVVPEDAKGGHRS